MSSKSSGKTLSRVIALLVCIIYVFTLGVPIITNAQEGFITNSFSDNEKSFNNPYMGWVKQPYMIYSSPYPGNLVWFHFTWADLEPQEGVYDYQAVEKRLMYQQCISKGYKFILLFSMDWPDKDGKMDIPDWLFNKINGDGSYYSTPFGTKGFSPNYSNQILIDAHRKAIEALAARYDNDNTFEILIGSVGHWGEAHTTYIRDKNAPGVYPKVEVESKYIEAYPESFKNVFLSTRYPRDITSQYGLTMHDHGFANKLQTSNQLDWAANGYIDWFWKEPHPAVPDYWSNGPVGAEFLGYPYVQHLKNDTIDNSLYWASLSHLTWVNEPPPNVLTSEVMSNMDKFLRQVGYRLLLKDITYKRTLSDKEKLDVNLNWTNAGVAPPFYNWPMELSLSDAGGNIMCSTTVDAGLRGWMPNTDKSINITLDVPNTVKNGSYNLNIAIINPSNGNPSVDFPIDANSFDKRYTVGDVNIERLGVEEISVIGPEEIPYGENELVVPFSVVALNGAKDAVPANLNAIEWSVAGGKAQEAVTIDSKGNVSIIPSKVEDAFTIKARYNSVIETAKSIQVSRKPLDSMQGFNSISFAPGNEAISSEGTGWVLQSYDRNQESSSKLVLAKASWRSIEPQKGVFKFDDFERSCNYKYWADKGYRFVLQFYSDCPDKSIMRFN